MMVVSIFIIYLMLSFSWILLYDLFFHLYPGHFGWHVRRFFETIYICLSRLSLSLVLGVGLMAYFLKVYL